MPPPLTDGVAVVLAAFHALNDDQRDDAAHRIHDSQERRQAGELSEGALLLLAMRRAASLAENGVVTPAAYRNARQVLAGTDEEIPPYKHVLNHFGSWAMAKQAFDIHEESIAPGKGGNQASVRRIEARFRSRRLHKIWRYTDETLRETLLACVRDIGRAPTVAEFDHWRDRQIELRKAAGDWEWHLPSATPYRKRWQSWDNTLRHFEIADPDARLERHEGR